MTIDGRFITTAGLELQGIRLSPGRADELAREVDRLNRVCLGAARRFGVDRDPSEFLSLLVELSCKRTG
ncbi:MAG: hypothetical protein ACT4P2_05225 [Pseudomonadota bacterium]